ncbi:LuxR family transcriptional regulator [Mycobacterium sp. ST-F2]|uniref:LuxR family transcriptional regulator n=1 Tax=Mycobacterium sp. ST-F2 TaxID=1490484 RepID=UPI00093E9EF4|nr:LuxR family transcriptional regulator [Mycobacterium sp. ST-F2]
MAELPTGTVTLLLADVEGSTQLWDTQPEIMKAAVARLDQTLAATVDDHRGVRPVEQGEGDSFVIAFTRALDAVNCALALQRTSLAPLKLRIGIHTGDVNLRDEGNYIGPTINRAARVRDLAHGGQTVLSSAAEPLVVDQLPAEVTLTDLGSHPLRDLPRPERVWQLCHPDLQNEFPPLRSVNPVAAVGLPARLTSFVGRRAAMDDIRESLHTNRLVTLTGAGGTGKTRLAVEIAAALAADATEYPDGIWYVDLAPLVDPDMVALTVARTLHLPEHPGQLTVDVLARSIRDRRILVLLDNCEHLLDACALLITALLARCPELTVLTTSREPVGVPGEVSWRVPSLPVADEAVELFTDRARRIKPDFRIAADNVDLVREICRRLDGLPLAIELAAARIRALTPAELLTSLRDTFRLLTGGARTAVRRQQTLRASVDWSYALLSEPEQALFRRLAVFYGGFDLDAAQAVAGDTERYQVLDQLTLLVDKSLVVADDSPDGTRYRLLETVRQYAQERLHECREGNDARNRHRDHYTAMAGLLEGDAHHRQLDRVGAEIDNLRAAFAWSRENSDAELALTLASSLLPLWVNYGLMAEGVNWLDAALAATDGADAPEARLRSSVCRAFLGSLQISSVDLDEAAQTLAAARELADPALVARALTACALRAGDDHDVSVAYFNEAASVAREAGEPWWLGLTLAFQAMYEMLFGEPAIGETAAAEALRIATTVGDKFVSRQSRFTLGWAQVLRGNLTDALVQLGVVEEESIAARDRMFSMQAASIRTVVLAYQGHVEEARTASDSTAERVADLFDSYTGLVYGGSAQVYLASGDARAAWDTYELARGHGGMEPQSAPMHMWAPLAPLACGDLAVARQWADEVVAATRGWSLAGALTARARVKSSQGDLDGAERDAHHGLGLVARLRGYLLIPFAFDGLGILAAQRGNQLMAVRLLGAADAARRRMGTARWPAFDPDYDDRIAALREALGDNEFNTAWAEGDALATEEAIAYAQRGRGERRRVTTGWGSLTRAELDVARLVQEGLPNKDIAAQLFISPRTVQAHLTHIFSKLELTSRVQLAREASRHG